MVCRTEFGEASGTQSANLSDMTSCWITADEIAAALSSGYGRARIASLHRDSLHRTEARVRRLERSASPLARPFLTAHDGALCVADFIIAFGAPDPLVKFLAGKSVRLDGGEQRLTKPLDAQSWIAFLGATRSYSGDAGGRDRDAPAHDQCRGMRRQA